MDQLVAKKSAKKRTRTRGDYRKQWRHIKWLMNIYSSKDYVVYIDKKELLDWETTPRYDKVAPNHRDYDLSQHNDVLNDAALLEATPCDDFSPGTRIQFRRLIGEAVACSLDHDYAGARSMLRAAKEYGRARSEEISRYWYLTASFGETLPFVFLGSIIWLLRNKVTAIFGDTATLLLIAVAAGAAGALLSVILRSGKLKFDCLAGWQLHYLEGASRIFAGSLSGVIVALAVHSQLFLGLLAQGGSGTSLAILAALAAGSSERLAGSIISKFETTEVRLSSEEQA